MWLRDDVTAGERSDRCGWGSLWYMVHGLAIVTRFYSESAESTLLLQASHTLLLLIISGVTQGSGSCPRVLPTHEL